MGDGGQPEPWISRALFEKIVSEALDHIPPDLASHLENVAVVVEDEPARELLCEMGLDPEIDSLYGLYQGTPLTERDGHPGGLPDRVVIYYRTLAEDFRDEYHLRLEIRRTVIHEVGHFFGFDDEHLEEMGY